MFPRPQPALTSANGSVADPVTELFNLETNSLPLKLIQRCLGVDALDHLYAVACAEQRDGEAFFAPLLRVLNVSWNVSPLDRQRIPKGGGAIVVANHPFGLIEGVVLGAMLEQVRPDVRIMANSLLGHFPQVAKSIILIDPFGRESSVSSNRRGLRESLAWLKSGGILGVFPAGEVASVDMKRKRVADPGWSQAIARLAALANVPVVPLFFAGRNGTTFQMAGLMHARLRTALLVREFLNKTGKTLEIRIGNLVTQRKLQEFDSDAERIEYLRRKTYVLANREEPKIPLPFLISRKEKFAKNRPAEQVPVIPPTDPVLMEREIAAPDACVLLDQQGDNSVYIGDANRLPNIVREIGRLRELTFREAGEGTGRETDIDEFDSYYLHLFVWNKANKEVVGAYRVGQTDLILKNFGLPGFYTSTLFNYGRRFLERVSPAIELGRSFVRLEYQKSYTPLLLLWRGIGAFVCRNPQYKILFGPVSISNDYHPGSKQLIVSFLKEYCRATDLARLVRARSPFRSSPLKKWDSETFSGPVWDIEELSALVADIETDQKGVPILLKQYLKLGGRLVSFNVDAAFSNALDGLIVVDLLKTERRLLERYLGKEGTAEFLAFHHQHMAAAR